MTDPFCYPIHRSACRWLSNPGFSFTEICRYKHQYGHPWL